MRERERERERERKRKSDGDRDEEEGKGEGMRERERETGRERERDTRQCVSPGYDLSPPPPRAFWKSGSVRYSPDLTAPRQTW